jgi:nicotinamide riboside transporter PnuC
VVCFYLGRITVIVHFIIDLQNKQYGRAFLDIFLLSINIYGIITWTKKEKTENGNAQIDLQE